MPNKSWRIGFVHWRANVFFHFFDFPTSKCSKTILLSLKFTILQEIYPLEIKSYFGQVLNFSAILSTRNFWRGKKVKFLVVFGSPSFIFTKNFKNFFLFLFSLDYVKLFWSRVLSKMISRILLVAKIRKVWQSH